MDMAVDIFVNQKNIKYDNFAGTNPTEASTSSDKCKDPEHQILKIDDDDDDLTKKSQDCQTKMSQDCQTKKSQDCQTHFEDLDFDDDDDDVISDSPEVDDLDLHKYLTDTKGFYRTCIGNINHN